MVCFQLYKITNNVNGKIYIGQTRRDNAKQRFYEHVRDSLRAAQGKCPDYPIYRAIRRYGSDNFSFEVIGVFDSLAKLNAGEIAAIAKYRSTDGAIGYNIEDGGNCAPKTDSTKKKLSEARKRHCESNLELYGQKLAPEHYDALKRANQVPWTEERRKKISDANIGQHRSPNTEFKKGDKPKFTPFVKGMKAWNAGKEYSSVKLKLSPDQVNKIVSDPRSSRVVAAELGIGKSTVSYIRRRMKESKT